MAKNFWQTRRPVLETKLINKKLTVSPFSYDSFFTRRSLIVSSDLTNVANYATVSFYAAFTFECWIKSFYIINAATQVLYRNRALTSAFDQFRLVLFENKLVVGLTKGAVEEQFISDESLPIGEWAHIAVTYDGTTCKIYINGNLQTSTFAIAAPLDQDGTGNYTLFGYAEDDLSLPFRGLAGPIRIWSVARTEEEINYYLDKPLASDKADLSIYYPFRDLQVLGSTIRTTEKVSDTIDTIALDATGFLVEEDDVSPKFLGASKVVAETSLVASAPFSFKYPVQAPENNNFALLVSWVENGQTQRRYFFTAPGVDIAPIPEEYRGEKIPENFKLEVWNIDGEETVDLLEEIVLKLSLTSAPTTNTDHTSIAEDETDFTNLLGTPVPLVYPLVFNTEPTYT